MNLKVNGFNIFLIVFVTFLLSLILVPIIKKLAIYIGAMDEPNERKIHHVPMPRLGGVAIFISFLIGYMIFGTINTQMISILIGSFLLLLIGIFDDIKPIKARYKLVVQILAAVVVVFYGQIYFQEISLFGLNISLNVWLAKILSAFFIVAIANAINLIDGLDGLAGGISSIYFITIAIIAFILNRFGGLDVLLCLIALGATLGFLVYNFPPAKIFMGDSGSLFLGFIIAVISLLGYKVATITSLVIPITILAIPIFDTLFAILRRLLKKQNITKADKEHFHHQLLKLKYSPVASILIIYAIDIMFASISIFYVLGDQKIAMVMYIIMLILLLFVVIKTDILFEHKKSKNSKELNEPKELNKPKKPKKSKKSNKLKKTKKGKI